MSKSNTELWIYFPFPPPIFLFFSVHQLKTEAQLSSLISFPTSCLASSLILTYPHSPTSPHSHHLSLSWWQPLDSSPASMFVSL